MIPKLSSLNYTHKKVLLRVDLNTPLNEDGSIADDTRIRACLPTIDYLLKQNASIILLSHLGRPDGKPNERYSLAPCAKRLGELLQKNVVLAPDCIGKATQTLANKLQPGQLLMLENLRFYKEEEKPSLNPLFAKEIASFGDLYVNDAFGAAHRAHSSIVSLPAYFPKKCAMGLLMEKEVRFLGSHFAHPTHPFHAIIGGAKISSKLGVLKTLLEKVDHLFIGGAMAYTFLQAQGLSIGTSLSEPHLIDQATEIMELAQKKKVALHLPRDLIITDNPKKTPPKDRILESLTNGIADGWEGVDIGPCTINHWKQLLKEAKTIFWNGPLGLFEISPFDRGTCEIARFLSLLDRQVITTIVGGGDSVYAIDKLGLANCFSHISTGGGASLEYIEHERLPGIEALKHTESATHTS